MKYLLNLPLAIAILLGWVFVETSMVPAGGGSSGGEYLTGAIGLIAVVLMWLFFGIVLTGCVATGGFDWFPVRSRSAIFLCVLGPLVLLSLLPVGVTFEAGGRSPRAASLIVWSARLVAAGVPLVVAAYAAWLINAPGHLRDLRAPRFVALAAGAALGLVAAGVTLTELAWPNTEAADATAARQQAAQAANDETRRAFAALTDADPLFEWDKYLYRNYTVPDDVQTEALRRTAARPNLEADLATGLASPNPLWVEEVLHLIVWLPFTPSAALGEPVRTAIIAQSARKRDTTVAAHPCDLYYDHLLARATAVSLRLAESAGVDLRDALKAMQRTVVEVCPKTEAAKYYPRAVAEAGRQIAAALATRLAR